MKTLTMAWRNVWRNSRRTLAAVAASSLGLWAMIVYSGMMTGYINRMERHILDVEMGDVQIHHEEYRKNPSLYHRIEKPEEILAALDAEGLAASPRLLGSGLAAAEDNSAGISLVGLDPTRDEAVSKVGKSVTEGQWLAPDTLGEVVIGRRLAQLLDLKVGGEIVLLSQGADGSMANDLYIVRGVLGSVSEAVDRGGVYMTEADFRELMVVPEGVHEIIVRRKPAMTLDAAKEAISAAAPDTEVKTWRELKPTMAQMLDSAAGAMVAMFLIVYSAIAIVILNAMLMAVFERVREFGVLKALGVSPFGVFRLIYLETMIQTGISIVIGVLLAVPANWYLSTTGLDLSASMKDVSVMGTTMDPIWRSEVSASSYTSPVIALVIIIAIAVIYPAIRAAVIKPITAMRHQ